MSLVPFKSSICGLEELAGHCERGVSHVLSILDPDWPVPEVFGQYGEHARLELRFHDVIDARRPDMIPPNEEHVAKLLAFGRELIAERSAHANLLVHCHAGVSRSTAALALILTQSSPDASAVDVLAEVLRIRPKAWPNLLMLEIGDAQLGRGGALVAAAAGVYRAQIDNRDYVADFMRAGGRGREVDAAAVG